MSILFHMVWFHGVVRVRHCFAFSVIGLARPWRYTECLSIHIDFEGVRACVLMFASIHPQSGVFISRLYSFDSLYLFSRLLNEPCNAVWFLNGKDTSRQSNDIQVFHHNISLHTRRFLISDI
jgi:hypothetical protein